MFRSRTISTQIDRPLAEVYEFLIEPSNFPKWAAALGGRFEHIVGQDWRADTAGGTFVIRFAERNAFGVLDHAVFREGEAPHVTPTRIFANDGGCELAYTQFQRPGMSDAQFDSQGEWISADFAVLKTYLEARPRR